MPYTYINFNTPQQKALETLTVSEAEKLLKEGVFGEGNMAPKIEACINFIKNGGKRALITEATKLNDSRYGTKIIPD